MKHYKRFKFLNDSAVSKFVTKKWIELNDSSSGPNSACRNIKFKTSMLRSNLSDYTHAYTVVKGRISVRSTNDANKINEKLTFKKMLHLNNAYQKSITYL